MTAFSPVGATPTARSTRSMRGTHANRLSAYAVQGLLDMLALGVGFGIADFVRHGRLTTALETTTPLIVLPLFLTVAFYARVYSYESLVSFGRAVGRVTVALSVALAINITLVFALKDSGDVSRLVFFTGAVLAWPLLIAVRLPVAWMARSMGPALMRRVVIVDGMPIDMPHQFEVIDASRIGIAPDVDNPMMLNNFSRMIAGADRVVVSCPPERRENWSIYLKGVGVWGELLVPELHGIAPLHDEAHLGVVGIRVSAGPLDMRTRVLKRLLDLLLTVPVIVLLTPIFLVTAIAIKLDSRGPVLFRQRRMGRGNQLFDVYKFRSMRAERTDHDGARSASRDDDRITRVGRIIRATSIDELPQLFNVLEGDMSLVGPRPHALGSLAGSQLFWKVDQRYWLRHAIKPGITGLAQVRGFRGATDHEDDLSNRLQSDLEYVANWTMLTDISILVRTALVLVHRNAY